MSMYDGDDDVVGPSFGMAPKMGDLSERSFQASQDTTLTTSVDVHLESAVPSLSDVSSRTHDFLIDERHTAPAPLGEHGSFSGFTMRSAGSTKSMASNASAFPDMDFQSEYSWSHFGGGVVDGLVVLFLGYRDRDTERAFVGRQGLQAYSIPVTTLVLIGIMTLAVFGMGYDQLSLYWPPLVWAVAALVAGLSTWRQVLCVRSIHREYMRRIEVASTSDRGGLEQSPKAGLPEWCTMDTNLSYRMILMEMPVNPSTVRELEVVTIFSCTLLLACNIAIWIALQSRVSWAADSVIQVMVFGAPFSLVALTSRLRFSVLLVMAVGGVGACVGAALIERYALNRPEPNNTGFILTAEYLSFHLVGLWGCLTIAAAREYVAREHFRRIADVDNAMKRLEQYTRGTRGLLEDRLPPRALGRFLTGEVIHDTAKDASVICIALSSSCVVSPVQYIRTLVALNRDIDSEARNHRIDKATVKGDAYWGTCGLCDGSLALQHSLKMMNFALSVLDLHPYSVRGERTQSIELRMGLHCASMASTIFGAATQGLDVVGSGIRVSMELTRYAGAGGIVATDAFMINLGRQTGPSIMDNYGQSFTRVQLQCTKLPIRIVHIQANILDGECVSPLLEVHGNPLGDPIAWFFNSQINPYLRVGQQAQYLMRLMKPRGFKLHQELGLGRRRRHRTIGGVHDREMEELSPNDAPNPLNPWGTKDIVPSRSSRDVGAADYHTEAYRRVQVSAAVALMVQSFVLLVLILTNGNDQSLTSIILVCVGGFLCAVLCNVLVLAASRLTSGLTSAVSVCIARAAVVLILVGVYCLNASLVKGDVSHVALVIVVIWPSLSMLHRRLLSAASLLISVVVCAAVLAVAQAPSEPLSFVFYTLCVSVFAIPLWLDHQSRSEASLTEEYCLLWAVRVSEQSRCTLWSLLKALIPAHLLLHMLELYGLSGVLDPIVLNATLQEAHNRHLELRKRALEHPAQPSICRTPPVFRWNQFAVGAFRLSELMSAQQVLAADLFQHISFTHQQLLSVMEACSHVTLLRAFGDLLLVGGFVGRITAAPALSDDNGPTNRNTIERSLSGEGPPIEIRPTHEESTHALMELLFVACTRTMRYRRTVSMRVGLHVGEVYGTFIGSSQVSFEFMGETVSTAMSISQYAPRDRPMASEAFVAAYEAAIDEVRLAVGGPNEEGDTHPLLSSDVQRSWAETAFKPFVAEWGPSVVLHSCSQNEMSHPASPLASALCGPEGCLMGMELLTATPLEF